MPLQETFGLSDDGKAVPGHTYLLDTRTGKYRDVVAVTSGKMPTPIDPTAHLNGQSAAGRCAMYGGAAKWKAED